MPHFIVMELSTGQGSTADWRIEVRWQVAEQGPIGDWEALVGGVCASARGRGNIMVAVSLDGVDILERERSGNEHELRRLLANTYDRIVLRIKQERPTS